MKFPDSALAHDYLDGLQGVEIGGAAHNPFGLATWNVDHVSHHDPRAKVYASAQLEQCGEVMPVDIVAPGDRLPIRDDGVDFVISSHVIEHFFDPVGALAEWARVARRYVFIICPQRDALEIDQSLPLTPLSEFRERHEGRLPAPELTDWHHSRWTVEGFCEMCEAYGYRVVATEDPDSKVGNGFTVVIEVGEAAVDDRRRDGWRALLDVRSRWVRRRGAA